MSEWSEIISGVLGGAAALVIQHAVSFIRNRLHAKRICDWFVAEASDPGGYKRRSTRAIAKGVNLTPERVTMLCHTSPRIRAVLGERDDLWSLAEDDRSSRGFFG